MRVRQGTTYQASRAAPLFAAFGLSKEVGTEETPPPPPISPSPPTAQLASGAYLLPGQNLLSRSGTASLVHQQDGNVVIYVSGSPIWSTNTVGAKTSALVMQTDGNLVLYDTNTVPLWASGTTGHPDAYAALSGVGALAIVDTAGRTLFTTPVPTPPPSSGNPIGDVLERSKRVVSEMMAVLATKVGPIPLFPRGRVYDWVNEVVAWTQKAQEVAKTDPEVAQAWAAIIALQPPDSRGGLFGAIDWVREKVGDAIRLAGTAVTFIAGDLPSPDDYEPENLCVTAWTNPPKFAILSAVAGLVFPPALLYMAAYVPPSPVGFTAGMVQAFIKGGGERVITKILEPVGDHIAEILNVVIDYALNQDVALIRWALRKIASRLGDGVPKGIILALADAANSVVEAIKNLPALKSEGFYIDVGESIERISDRFEGRLQGALRLAGAAIKAGGAAISIILNRGVEGLKDAKDTLMSGLLGIPGDFDALSQRAQTEIAKAKAPLIGTAGAIVQNLHQGIADLASAAENIPGNLGDLARTLLDLVSRLAGDARAFLERLLGLAATSEEPTPGGGAPVPAPAPTPAPSPAGGGLSKIFAIGAGGLLGAILGGPIGGVVGAGAGAALAKD